MAVQIPEAIFNHGNQERLDHTPGAAVVAGTVLSFGSGSRRLTTIADTALIANKLEAVNIGGMYQFTSLFSNRRSHRRMAVTEGANADAT